MNRPQQSYVSNSVPEWPSIGLEAQESCPVCRSYERSLHRRHIFDRINKAPGYWNLYQCSHCSTGYLDPRPNKQTISLAYKEYYTHQSLGSAVISSSGGAARALRNGYLNEKYGLRLKPHMRLGAYILPLIPFLRKRADHYIRHLPPFNPTRRKLLEIGCGNGSFLAEMSKVGWQVLGVEPDLQAVKSARKLGLDVMHGSLDDIDLDHKRFDAITLNHVIEHVHNPIQTLTKCKNLLSPGGTVSIVTPNLISLGSRVFREDWYPLHPPCHLVLFTPSSLYKALTISGFSKIKVHTSFYGAQSIFKASRLNSPRLRKPGIFEQISWPPLLNLLASLHPSLNEEIVITAQT
jgi:2-polyprenyl-3-methyl-5-hydroxy-6-metoxy-1,4-benzoquinol methylase